MMWWHGELWTIAAVESLAKHVMGDHDFQSRHKRDRANAITRYFKSSNELRGRRCAVTDQEATVTSDGVDGCRALRR
jgi:hypothetical protein